MLTRKDVWSSFEFVSAVTWPSYFCRYFNLDIETISSGQDDCLIIVYWDLRSFQNTGHGHQLNKFLINKNELKYLEAVLSYEIWLGWLHRM